MNHRSHKAKKFITWVKKNTSLVSGLAAILITILFVSSVVILGQSGQLTSVTHSGAIDQTVTYQEITCSSVIVSSNVGVRGNLVLNILNSGERVVSQSAPFQLPFPNETTLVRFPQIPASGVYTFFITQNAQVIGQNATFNMMCPAPQVYFNNHTCTYVDLVSIQPLSGQFQVAVLFGSGEEGEPARVVRLSQPFTFTAQNTARANFTTPLNSNDDFIYVLYRNGVFIAYGSGGGSKFLECYVPPTPTPTPNLPPVGNVDSIIDGRISGWARDPNTTAPIQVQLFLDGTPDILFPNRFLGSVNANQLRSDLPFADKNHGFTFQLPSNLRDSTAHRVFAYGIDSAGGSNPQLSGSPFGFTWLRPSPSPSPSRSPSPSPSPTPTPTPTPSPTPSRSPSPTPVAYGCDNQSFYTVNLSYPHTKACFFVPNLMYDNESRFNIFHIPTQYSARFPFVRTENIGIKEDRNLHWSITSQVSGQVFVMYRKIPGQVPPGWITDKYQKLTNDDWSNLNQYILRKNELGLIGVYDIYRTTVGPNTTVEFGPASDNTVTAFSMYLVGISPGL